MLILVVDDERTIADTLSQILKQSGFEVATAYSAEAAYNLALVAKPEWLVSDVILGGMNGIDLAIAFAIDFPLCRVLLMSGQTATGDLLMEAGGRGHHFNILAKPFHPQVLLDTLRSECPMAEPA